MFGAIKMEIGAIKSTTLNQHRGEGRATKLLCICALETVPSSE